MLRSDPPQKEDWWAAAELIENGYAKGSVHRSNDVVDQVALFAPTMAGRQLAEEIETEQRQRSTRGTILRWAGAALAGAGALTVATAGDAVKALVLRWLGL